MRRGARSPSRSGGAGAALEEAEDLLAAGHEGVGRFAGREGAGEVGEVFADVAPRGGLKRQGQLADGPGELARQLVVARIHPVYRSAGSLRMRPSARSRGAPDTPARRSWPPSASCGGAPHGCSAGT